MPHICPTCHGIPKAPEELAHDGARHWLHSLVELAEAVVDAVAEAGQMMIHPTICGCNGLKMLLSNEAYVEARADDGALVFVIREDDGDRAVVSTDKPDLMREVVLQYMFNS